MEEVEVFTHEFKELKDDNELKAAIEELQYLVNTTALLFTEGASMTSDTGVKVLVERLRLGAESLKNLGVEDDDPLIVEFNNTLTDDDALAEGMKNRLKLIMYEQLKNPSRSCCRRAAASSAMPTAAHNF